MDGNKVTVKIYGHEYVISGDSSREQIMRVADFVDSKMQEMEKALGAGPISRIAVLSCLNIVDDLFTVQSTIERLEEENRDTLKECEHYSQLWEEAKNNYIQYKEDAQSSIDKFDKIQKLFNDKVIELNQAEQRYAQLEEKYDKLNEEYGVLVDNLKKQEENKESTEGTIKEWEEKCKDMENSFFDLQMENIKLKGEIDRYKKIIE